MSTQGDPPSQDYMAVARSPSSPWPGGICFRPEGPLAVDREAEEALRSASLLACNSGMTVEILNLKKDCVVIRRHPDEDGKWGDLVYHVWAEAAGGIGPRNQKIFPFQQFPRTQQPSELTIARPGRCQA